MIVSDKVSSNQISESVGWVSEMIGQEARATSRAEAIICKLGTACILRLSGVCCRQFGPQDAHLELVSSAHPF